MTTGKINVSVENIFPLIKKFLYSDHEIFLRELVSNATDATLKLKHLTSIGEAKVEYGNPIIEVKIDKEGKKGKSEFLKWICHNYPKECIKLSQASESQLRAAVIKCGPKRCYFFDLRQIDELNDKMDNLMSIIDEIKNGHVMNTIYGANQSLIMPNPHVFIFSNKALKYDSLSKDRWEIYEISNDFKFKSIDINTNISQDGEIVLKKITSNLPFLKKRNILALIIYFMLSLYR